MNNYDFGQAFIIDMPDSLKWHSHHNTGVLPFDLADMDFCTAPEITEALTKRAAQGQFSYGVTPDALSSTVVERMASLYQWSIQPEWIVWLPGTVSGLRVATMSLCQPGEAVLTFTPAYTPFLHIPQSFDRQLSVVPLREAEWQIDFVKLEQSITPQTKLLLLCNPHNPTGVMWSKNDVDRLVDICAKYDITICSDEVHAELVLNSEKRHIPTASSSELAAERTVTLMSASKTFNIAGMSCGFAIIPNADIRERFKKVRQAIVPAVPLLGYAATLAAFTQGEDWRKALIAYLRQNKQLVSEFCTEFSLPLAEIDASYLAWIDVRKQPRDQFVAHCKKHGISVYDGADFGCPGFIRLNFACSREQLQKGLACLRAALVSDG